jgi:hypothetical protein
MGYSEGEEFSEGRMGDDYFVLPAGQLGGLDISDVNDHYTVKSSDGEEIGHVHKVVTSSQGDLSYAIIRQKDGQLISVPWQALKGAGNKSFKLKVTKNQLGSLPTLQQDENAVQHVQQEWNLSEVRQKTRDRFRYGQREFSREDYDQDRERSSRSRFGDDRQSRNQRFGFSPSEFSPPAHAPQYEGDDRHGSFDRNRRTQNQPQEEPWYRDSRSGSDRSRQFFDRRQSFDQDRQGRYSDRYQDRDDRFRNRDNQGRDMFSQSREGKGDDYERYQNRGGERGQNYDYRPESYRP